MNHKVLSLLQPWASLLAGGHKEVETRSFNTKYRGPLLIHASVKFNSALHETALQSTFFDILHGEMGYKFYGMPGGRNNCRDTMPRGAIIGMVNLVETFQFGTDRSKEYIKSRTMDDCIREVVFGDWTKGRWGWRVSDPVIFETPIPAKGQLSIWNWEGELPQIK